MNSTLLDLVMTYATRDHAAVRARLQGMSKDLLIALVTDLLTIYINDKNSSTLREWITAEICGFTHEPRKVGYNGYRQDGIGNTTQYCEVKPQNCEIASGESYKGLHGGGSFNGYTHARFAKDRRENPTLLISGFVDGRLLYILEIPFNAPEIWKTIERKLWKELPDGDETSHYIIGGANFAFNDYKGSPELKIRYVAPWEQLEALAAVRPRVIAPNLLEFLRDQAYPKESGRLFSGKGAALSGGG